MPNFRYQAYSEKGKKIEGVFEAETRDSVADHLHEQGFKVISITEDLSDNFKKALNFQIGGIPLKEKVFFARQLSIMLTAGVPVVQALRILIDQAKNDFVKKKLDEVYRRVESGTKLSEAFAKDKIFFNEIQLNLLAAGEKSGNLNEIMIKIADDLEKSRSLKNKIRGAMIYPTVIFFVIAIVIMVVVVFMIPSVEGLYEDLGGGELPAVTRSLVVVSDFVTNPLGLLITVVSIIFMVLGFRYYNSTEGGKKNVDTLRFKLPVFGNLSRMMHLAQFCRLLSMLMQSGVPIVQALKVVANSLENSTMSEAVARASEDVTKGVNLSSALSTDSPFPDILLKILETGEETGNLDNVLDDMGKYYSGEVEDLTNNLTKLMEPLILLIVGGLVGFIAVAVYLPIYSIGSAV